MTIIFFTCEPYYSECLWPFFSNRNSSNNCNNSVWPNCKESQINIIYTRNCIQKKKQNSLYSIVMLFCWWRKKNMNYCHVKASRKKFKPMHVVSNKITHSIPHSTVWYKNDSFNVKIMHTFFPIKFSISPYRFKQCRKMHLKTYSNIFSQIVRKWQNTTSKHKWIDASAFQCGVFSCVFSVRKKTYPEP